MPETRDIKGIKFNRLTALSFIGKTRSGVHLWKFICDCGKECIKRKQYVTSGALKSCGCLQREAVSKAAKKHGLTHHPLARIWRSIKARCYNPNNHEYKRYGAKGVIICDEWKNDFKKFYDWCMANGWKQGLQVDKDILSNKLGLKIPIYSPQTCSIITGKENSNNTKWNKNIEYNGVTRTLAQWGEVSGIPANTILCRLRYGWDVKSALTISTTKTGNKKCFH